MAFNRAGIAGFLWRAGVWPELPAAGAGAVAGDRGRRNLFYSALDSFPGALAGGLQKRKTGQRRASRPLEVRRGHVATACAVGRRAGAFRLSLPRISSAVTSRPPESCSQRLPKYTDGLGRGGVCARGVGVGVAG